MLRSLVIAAITITTNCLGQLVLDKNYYARVIVPEDVYATVTLGSIDIDTLIMDRNSSLKFERRSVTMNVKKAVIETNVTWDGAGESGVGTGGHGTMGANLNLYVSFSKLGQLTIDTRGGSGMKGAYSSRNFINSPSGNGGSGGNGGNGGSVYLSYRSEGFTPIFKRAKTNSLIVKTKGGAGGTGGSGEAPNPRSAGSNSSPGEQGNKGRDGELIIKEVTYAGEKIVLHVTPKAPKNKKESKEPLMPNHSWQLPKPNEYDIVLETLREISGTLDKPNRTAILYDVLREFNSSMKLGLILESNKFHSLSTTLPGKIPYLLLESDASTAEIAGLCDYLKTAITRKLDSVKLIYDFPEYFADFLLTSVEKGSTLFPVEVLNARPKHDGFQSERDSGGYTIMGLAEGTKAYHSGLRNHDRVVRVNDIPTAYLGGGALHKLTKLGSGLTTQISAARNGKSIELTLEGSTSEPSLQKTKLEILPANVLYFRPGYLMRQSVTQLKTWMKDETNLPALIIDLRDCPGGGLDDAIELANLFLAKGDTIARVKSSHPYLPEVFLGTEPNPIKPKTLIVLTDGATSSGAEVVAGALQFNNAAQVIGFPTNGFGEIATQRPVGRGKFILEIKVGDLQTPKGLNLSSFPIQPDILVDRGGDPLVVALEIVKKK